MGAYACVPMWGSEPGAGWYWAEAASQDHDVWILTAEENRDRIEACLDEFPVLREGMHPVYVAVPGWASRLRTGGNEMHLPHYLIWQRVARQVARRLHDEVGFDVAHHVTWTVSWLPAAVTRIPGLPFVWGPVSGAMGVPRPMWRWLGWPGAAKELVREVGLPVMRLLFARRPLRRAAMVLAQSEEFARWARSRTSAPVVVEPVPALRGGDFERWQKQEPQSAAELRTAVFAARFSAWKGLRLVVAAMARPEATGWRLEVYGDGREEPRARALVAKLGVEDRVHFRGRVPRRHLDEVIAQADAFIQPSFHDAPPFVVAEALSIGCPIVCLDVGGPAALVGPGEGVKVPVERDLAGALARGLAGAPTRFAPSTRWHMERLPERMATWYAEALRSAARTA